MSGVLALAGSARAGSVNGKLLGLARAEVEALGLATTTLDLRALDLPIYDGDIEAAGEPVGVDVLRQAIASADGLLIASPEYNHSLAPLLKNAIDWVSHPLDRSPFPGKPAAIMSAAARPWGGTRMLPHLRDVLTDLGCVVLPAMVAVPVAHTAFDEADRLRDANIAAYLNKAMAQFAAEVRLRAPAQRIAA